MLREAAAGEVALRDVRLLGRPGRWTVTVLDGLVAAVEPCGDAGGGPLLLPGFHDPHVHVLAMARELEAVRLPASLRGGRALAAELRRGAADLRPGQWLRVRGFDHDAMTSGWIPDRRWLDEVAGDRPVRLQHRNLRLDLLNTAALAQCGLAGDGRVFQDGGAIRTPPPSPGRLHALVAQVSARLLADGVTSIQDAGAHNGPSELALLDGLARSGAIRQRLWTMASGLIPRAVPSPRVRHAKLAPVEARLDLDELCGAALAASRAGLSVAIHATTEAELAAAVAAIEAAGPGRHRIEHAAVATPALVTAVARTGAAVVANPSLVAQAGDGYRERHSHGEHRWLHRLKSWQRAGVPLAIASDAPVTPSRPLDLVRAATTRRTASGAVLAGAEALSPAAAVHALTRAPAALVGEGHRLGRVAPGFHADLVAVEGGRVAFTMLAGEIVT